ncbi:MAG: hypothetical protein ACRDWV_09475 [Acidimicrobiales bacterium]
MKLKVLLVLIVLVALFPMVFIDAAQGAMHAILATFNQLLGSSNG